jgi:hypothetical protein
MDSLHFSPGTLVRDIHLADGVTNIVPGTGNPRPVVATDADWHMTFALTPTSTAFTISKVETDEGMLTVTGATARLQSCAGLDPIGSTALRHLRVFARRKPGTTGSMAAQTITFGGTSSSGATFNEMGRISVLANSGTGEPDADFHDKSYVAGHASFSITETNPFKVNITAVDTDLELVIEIYGARP